jgi:hypothetical protein
MGSWRNLFVGTIIYVWGSYHLRESYATEDFAGILFGLTGMTAGLVISIQPNKMPD